MARTIVLSFGGHGDVTAKWDADNDAVILPEIQKLIDSGYLFFILEADQSDRPVTSIDDVSKVRNIVIPNATLEKLHQDGLLTVGGVVLGETTNTGEIATTAEQVAEADTVVVPPAKGG
jgi:hypothetical protein